VLEIVQLGPSRPACQQPPGGELTWCAIVYQGRRLCGFEWDATTGLDQLLLAAARHYREFSQREACRQLEAALSAADQHASNQHHHRDADEPSSH
jgi:hypothetical protein